MTGHYGDGARFDVPPERAFAGGFAAQSTYTPGSAMSTYRAFEVTGSRKFELVERETPNAEERPLVAGVFYNRLRLGDPLQCDPTVQYAMELAGHPEKNVHAVDLRVDSLYNTYEHRDLPPGGGTPNVTNPGGEIALDLSAIRASLGWRTRLLQLRATRWARPRR